MSYYDELNQQSLALAQVEKRVRRGFTIGEGLDAAARPHSPLWHACTAWIVLAADDSARTASSLVGEARRLVNVEIAREAAMHDETMNDALADSKNRPAEIHPAAREWSVRHDA